MLNTPTISVQAMPEQYLQQNKLAAKAKTSQELADYLMQKDGPFSGLGGVLMKGIGNRLQAKADANQTALAAQAHQADAQAKQDREDAAARRDFGYKMALAQAGYDHDDQVRAQNRQWSMADALDKYAHEKEMAQAQRGNALADRQAQWAREDTLRQQDRGNATADALLKYGAPAAQKALTAGDYQKWLQDPTQQIEGQGWFSRFFGRKASLAKPAADAQMPYASASDEELMRGL